VLLVLGAGYSTSEGEFALDQEIQLRQLFEALCQTGFQWRPGIEILPGGVLVLGFRARS